MFKSWKKKTPAKTEGTESKRFSLLGSKKSRNSEIPPAQNIKTYSFSPKSEEKLPEVISPKPYTSATDHSVKVNDTNNPGLQFVTVSHIQNTNDVGKPITTKGDEYTVASSNAEPEAAIHNYEENILAARESADSNTVKQTPSIPSSDCGFLKTEDFTSGGVCKDLPLTGQGNEEEQDVKYSVEINEKATTLAADSKFDGSSRCHISEGQSVDDDKRTIYQLDSQVQKLQRQVKDIRQYFKGLLKRDTEGLVTASIKIQALARGYLVRKTYQDYIFVKLRGYRSVKRPMSLNQMRKECALIGNLMTEDTIDTEQDLAALNIQKTWRGYMVRERLARYTLEQEAAVRIQSLWRGYRIREMNPRIMIRILQKRSSEQQKSIQRLAYQVKILQHQMSEEIVIQKEHADSLNYLHSEIRQAKLDKAVLLKKPAAAVRKPRQSTGPPVVDISRFASVEDFAYLKAEIEFLHQRMDEISLGGHLGEENTSR